MGNLNVDQLAALQASPEVTVNSATDKLDKAITESLTVDLTNDVTLTNAQYRTAMYFNVTPAGTSKTLTFPAVKRTAYVKNSGANPITVKVGSTTFTLANGVDPAFIVTDGTTNGLVHAILNSGVAANGLPTGGSTGDVLTKNSGTDFDASFAPPAGGGGGGGSYPLEGSFTVPPAPGSWTHSDLNSIATTAQAGVGGNTTTQIIFSGTNSGDATASLRNDITSGGAGGASGWRVSARFRRWFPLFNFVAVGLVISDGTKVYAMGQGAWSALQSFLTSETATTLAGAGAAQGACASVGAVGSAPFDIWLRVHDNKTNRIWSFSYDGLTWVDFFTDSRTSFLTATQVGFGGFNDNKGSVTWTADCVFECLSWLYEDLP